MSKAVYWYELIAKFGQNLYFNDYEDIVITLAKIYRDGVGVTQNVIAFRNCIIIIVRLVQ